MLMPPVVHFGLAEHDPAGMAQRAVGAPCRDVGERLVRRLIAMSTHRMTAPDKTVLRSQSIMLKLNRQRYRIPAKCGGLPRQLQYK
jgi:hypothetical protein